MASIKVKFMVSSVAGKEGSIVYQVIHERVTRRITTSYAIFPDEWCKKSCQVVVPAFYDKKRASYLRQIGMRIERDVERLEYIILRLRRKKRRFTSSEIVAIFKEQVQGGTVFAFMQEVVRHLETLRKRSTTDAYRTAFNSFRRFRGGEDLLLVDITPELMIDYEAYLKQFDVAMNTISFYMRILRAVYNRAVEQRLVEQCYPFKYVYTGVAKTIKRAISLRHIKRIKELDLSYSPQLERVRDMFLFSFYTRGMSFVDMAYLRKKELNNGVLSYYRRKTGQFLHVKWEACMEELVVKYNNPNSPLLLPIISQWEGDVYRQYRNGLHMFNNNLKKIGELVGLETPLTMYVARHSWASIARSRQVPLSVISEGMGHDNETTTQIYFASLDTSLVDNANSSILQLL